MQFQFATASTIQFGCGVLKNLESRLFNTGSHTFVIGGSDLSRLDPLVHLLHKSGNKIMLFQVTGEPTIPVVLDGVERARSANCDRVIAMGGGSVLDTGKVVAAMLSNSGDLMDYLEVIGRGQVLKNPSVPFVAIPTTAGTGTEVTRNAVVKSLEHEVKVSLRSGYLLPQLAVVDPELTLSMPPEVTAGTGLDALTQLIEPYVSRQSNPMTDLFCVEGMKRVSASLRTAFRNPSDLRAREDMALASLYGGLALANAKLGAVHGIAGPLGGMIDVGHGVACARLLPVVIEANVRMLRDENTQDGYLQRFDEVGRLLTGNSEADSQDAVVWIQSLCEDLKVRPLSKFGLKERHIPQLVEKAQKASSMKGNPVRLSEVVLERIIRSGMSD